MLAYPGSLHMVQVSYVPNVEQTPLGGEQHFIAAQAVHTIHRRLPIALHSGEFPNDMV